MLADCGLRPKAHAQDWLEVMGEGSWWPQFSQGFLALETWPGLVAPGTVS